MSPSSYVWHGHVEGVAESSVIFAVEGSVTAGEVLLPGARFGVRYAGGDLESVEQINPAAPEDDINDAIAAPTPVPPPVSPPSTLGSGVVCPDDPFADVMAFYTPMALCAHGMVNGSLCSMRAQINLTIADTNTAFTNSLIQNKRLRLVHVERLDFPERGYLYSEFCSPCTTCLVPASTGITGPYPCDSSKPYNCDPSNGPVFNCCSIYACDSSKPYNCDPFNPPVSNCCRCNSSASCVGDCSGAHRGARALLSSRTPP